jgi:hypothetical protein
MRRIFVLISAFVLALGMMAVPAAAHHDHILVNPSGCVTIPVGHQDHAAWDAGTHPGRKFHGAAHVGSATEGTVVDGVGTLGRGNSGTEVAGDTPGNRAALC